MPGFHTATVMVRVGGGMAAEPADLQGLAYVLEQTVDKGVTGRDARQLADAFDACGIRHAVYTGRQSWVLIGSCLPEFLPRAIELLGEVVREPVFPDDAVATAVNLAQQELSSIEDAPRALLRRQMARQAYGDVLGRHILGSEETLALIDAEAVRRSWSEICGRRGLTVAVAGNYDGDAVRDTLEAVLAPLPEGREQPRELPHTFSATRTHIDKPFDQVQIGLSFAGAPYYGDDFVTEKVILAVLSGGMSSRLFTEVREKQGLVYWVGAWHEQPRGLGMIHIGGATNPKRCQQTFDTILREVGRLEEDLTEEELERAKTGLLSDSKTGGASVQRRANELLTDHFHLQRTIPQSDKIAAVRAVTRADVCGYLDRHPRDEITVVTVGQQAALNVGR